MKSRFVSTPSVTARLVAVASLIAVSVIVGAGPASAAPPQFTAPDRIYGLPDVPLPFAGLVDPISGDTHAIDLTVANSAGCNPVAPTYDLTGCARVQLDVSHGKLSVAMQQDFPDADVRDGIATGGAIVDSSTDGNGTGLAVALNGTLAQLNAALDTLVFTPDSGYKYNGSNSATLNILVVHNDPGTESMLDDVQIRIQPVDDAPTLTVPPGPYNVAAGSTTVVEPPSPPGPNDLGLFSVADPDVEEEPGLDDRMLLVMFATCGEFQLRGGALTLENDITDLLLDADFPEEFVTPLVAALPPEITGRAFATGNPGDPHVALAGIGDFDEVNYALSSIDFIAPASAGSCDLWTIVHDLGNQGLPFQYIGSPPTGFEVPALLGVDFDTVTFVVDGGVEVSLPPTLSVSEGDALSIPVTVDGTNHPAFDVSLTSAPVAPTTLADFSAATSPLTFAESAAGPVLSTLATTEDLLSEGPETLTVSIDPASLPAGVTVGNATVTVTILDDEAPPDTTAPTVTVNQGATQVDPTAVSPIVYDVVFSEPVTGLTASDFSSTGTTAGGLLILDLVGSGTTYTASISGMTTAGNVVVTLPAGAAQDAALNDSAASTAEDNTVIWAPPPPDTTSPTVTVNQGATQVDPTSVSPIVYDVVFSEPVTGLTASDFSSTGTTAGGLLILDLVGSGTTYTASISGMTTAGNVVLTLPAGAAQDAALNLSAASTATDNAVAFVPPVVETPTPTPDPTVTPPATANPTTTGGATVNPTATAVPTTTTTATATTTTITRPDYVSGKPLAYTGIGVSQQVLTALGLLTLGLALTLVARRTRPGGRHSAR